MVNQMNARSILSFFNSIPKSLGFALLIWVAAMMPARAGGSVELRVAIEQNAPQVNVGSSGTAQVLDGSGQVVGEIQAMNGFAAQAKNGGVALDRWKSGAMWIVPKQATDVVWIGNRWYRGRVYLVPTGKGLTAVNYVDLEQYLFSVLGAEMNGNWPQEALKAQAVAARSYAVYKLQGARNSINSVFDLDDTTRSQVYNGVQSESTGTQQAVLSTAGQVLAYNNRVVEAYFHSSAGGCTEGSENVWSTALPYFQSRQVGFDEGTPVSAWSKTLSLSEMSSHFGVGNIQRIAPKNLTKCGRVLAMEIVGDRGTKIVKGDDIQAALNLRSTLFTIAAQPIASKAGGKATLQFVVTGRGFGHGVGMSQWGAYNMARQGKKYNEILPQYYIGAVLVPLDPQ
ncbi:MAG: SpoIID/LytB domain-containing protein [Plectolyngbya sp. WJT66-NPBG17]|jgi:stage II sporulation protein D|nr:SpoIID/LytB domain-containing protein [Plectolyngbya sp. WJT66-NPBG17]MBW4527572.1 SpoIID/LytB domain-containing protein [Phormidium tanganyikae FI6-MK23]